MGQSLTEEEIIEVLARIDALSIEHRDLDLAISALEGQPYIDQMQMRRMKRRKLLLKDMIHKLESMLIPDQPA